MANVLRPQLTKAQAVEYSAANVLRCTGVAGDETVDPWCPWLDEFMAGQVVCDPDYIGTPELGLADVVNQAVTECAGPDRIYIGLEPGEYKGPVFIPQITWQGRAVPVTIYGMDADPSRTKISANVDAEMPGEEYQDRFAGLFTGHAPEIIAIFDRISAHSKITTANTSVVRVENDGCQLRNMTLVNTYNADRLPQGADDSGATRADFQQSTGQHQAVALLVAGADQVHCENLHLESFQDTLYLKSPAPFTTSRSYFKGCKIAGDVDFIFGQTTAYFTDCTIVSRGSRALHAWVAAPSTNIRTSFGFVFSACTFAHDGSENALAGRFSLGRQWFESVRATPYGVPSVLDYTCDLDHVSEYNEPNGTISRATLEAVGKCVILRSKIGAHINPAAPWDDWNGGTFGRDGEYTPGVWNARFRPVQFRAADVTSALSDWLPAQPVDLSDVSPDTVFLAEFDNQEI